MRNVTLNELTEQVRAEARLSTNASRGLDDLSNIQQKIRRVQEELYDEFDWPFMRISKEDATKTLAAGQRYYDFPTNLNMERAFTLYTNTQSIWTPLEQGISMATYSEQDSDENERSDPALRWDIHNETQFEIWPLPSSNGGLVRFDGLKKLTSMVDTGDRADLDDKMIVLFVAAEILAANKQADAQLILEKANRRKATMQGRLVSKKRLFMGGAQEEPRTGLHIRVPRVSL